VRNLGEKGPQALDAIGRAARAHDETLLTALDAAERRTLRALLIRVAEEQGLVAGVHPGYGKLGPPGAPTAPDARRTKK
jgi:hypothetical protein